ncbi:protoporphyrin IX magnesium-chelatase [Ectothiorhodosinus mongolicus]|uniref:Mg-protoporphyrin IX chelatase n=1 Tax=Ectothiorhodosinus mongolicus TaxID=233100 RepID=A0A1R3W666_9GAMM|nr:magnesium chelatase subunit D [Ectothiorhodosinus mongolicus]ULX57624.1 magnesium chelatase ATPase subunit D [Ectothiorhodosinus mongolicus]SIT73168.1 protoporphyrin IX magnesium-chelatase [Ectothiorhodosinus mongolicus]
MSKEPVPEFGPWTLASIAAGLFAVDPTGLGGVSLHAHAGPVRDTWTQQLRDLLPPEDPLRRMPLNIADGRLLGGLDLAATLRAGRPVAEQGLLAECDGGVVIAAMAERLTPSAAGRIAAVMDNHEVLLERDGLGLRLPARFGLVALDESMNEEEAVPKALLDRLAFLLDLEPVARSDTHASLWSLEQVRAAREKLPEVSVDEELLKVLCGTALALGVYSLRIPLLALRAARAAAALDGRSAATEEDAALAARLVLAPRATRLPAMEEEAEPEPPPPEEPPPEQDQAEDQEQQDPADLDKPLEDRVLDAAKAALPAGLLAQLQAGLGSRSRSQSSGKAGALQQGNKRGRPIGTRRGELKSGARLNVIETLRAAAPWQPIRRAQALAAEEGAERKGPRVHVRRDDFRIQRFKQRSETTTIFAVDASGSAALHRLAEAKGAVELLLADCYVRRDRVGLIAFRGQGSDLLLPPTRSLVRAKRGLAALPGGGGTPLANAIDAVRELAESVKRRGETPVAVFLTDGRANIARDGSTGRQQATEDALSAARELALTGIKTILVDTSPRPQSTARELAMAMQARYLPLPHADAQTLSTAVQSAAA